MPPALLRACAHSGCPNVQPETYCDQHQPKRELGLARFNVAVRRWYRTARWQSLRRRVLAEEPFCQVCAAEGRPVTDTTDVDHIRRHGGDVALFWDRRNLQALCHACHSRKTQRGE